MRTYKYICKKCHSRQTNSPDQLCSKCRYAEKSATKPCIICHDIKTASPDGVCWRCRKKVPMEEFDENKLLKEAIARYKRDLMVLSHRQDGLSYGQISDESPAWAFDNKDKT